MPCKLARILHVLFLSCSISCFKHFLLVDASTEDLHDLLLQVHDCLHHDRFLFLCELCLSPSPWALHGRHDYGPELFKVRSLELLPQILRPFDHVGHLVGDKVDR